MPRPAAPSSRPRRKPWSTTTFFPKPATWPLGSGLVLFVPTGRAENPLTKTNWEGTGVIPDTAVPPAQTFATAYAAALTATHQAPAANAATDPDSVLADRLLVRRTQPYPTGAEIVRRSVEGLAQGQQPFDLYSPGVAEALKGPVPEGLPAMMVAQGPLQSVTFVRVDDLGGDEYDVRFAVGEQIWNIVVNSAGKVVSTNFRPK